MTKNYYNSKANDFIENTLNVDMSEQYQFFKKYLPNSGKILDIGFGSGRDSLYFSRNYDVTSIDNSEIFVEKGKQLLKNPVILMDVKEMNFTNEFNGIWACASLLHIPYQDLKNVLILCYQALKDNGVMYLSFKYGTFEGERNGRYFTNLNEERLCNLLSSTSFKLVETIVTLDVRPDRPDEKWLNIIIKK